MLRAAVQPTAAAAFRTTGRNETQPVTLNLQDFRKQEEKVMVQLLIDGRRQQENVQPSQFKVENMARFGQKLQQTQGYCQPATGEKNPSPSSEVYTCESFDNTLPAADVPQFYSPSAFAGHDNHPMSSNHDLQSTCQFGSYQNLKIDSSEERILLATVDNPLVNESNNVPFNYHRTTSKKENNLFTLSDSSSIKSPRDLNNGFETQRGTTTGDFFKSARYKHSNGITQQMVKQHSIFKKPLLKAVQTSPIEDFLNSEEVHRHKSSSSSPTIGSCIHGQQHDPKNISRQVSEILITLNPNQDEDCDGEDDWLAAAFKKRSSPSGLTSEKLGNSSIYTATLRVRDAANFTQQSFGGDQNNADSCSPGGGDDVRLFNKSQLRHLCESNESTSSICEEFQENTHRKHDKPSMKDFNVKPQPPVHAAGHTEITVLTTQGEAVPNSNNYCGTKSLNTMKTVDAGGAFTDLNEEIVQEDEMYINLYQQIRQQLETANKLSNPFGFTSQSSAHSQFSLDVVQPAHQEQLQDQQKQHGQSVALDNKSSEPFTRVDIFPVSQKVRIQQDNQAIREKLKSIVFSHTPKKVTVIQSEISPLESTPKRLSQGGNLSIQQKQVAHNLLPPQANILSLQSNCSLSSKQNQLSLATEKRMNVICESIPPHLQASEKPASLSGFKNNHPQHHHERRQSNAAPSMSVKQKAIGLPQQPPSSLQYRVKQETSENNSRRTSLENNSRPLFSCRQNSKMILRTKSSQEENQSHQRVNNLSSISTNMNDSSSCSTPANRFIRLSDLIGGGDRQERKVRPSPLPHLGGLFSLLSPSSAAISPSVKPVFPSNSLKNTTFHITDHSNRKEKLIGSPSTIQHPSASTVAVATTFSMMLNALPNSNSSRRSTGRNNTYSPISQLIPTSIIQTNSNDKENNLSNSMRKVSDLIHFKSSQNVLKRDLTPKHLCH